MRPDDRPLDTQTAAPHPAPPRPPVVAAAMADDHGDFWERQHLEQKRQIAALIAQCDAILAEYTYARGELEKYMADVGRWDLIYCPTCDDGHPSAS
jgi:hypothetical protein